jgi:hypothetical protein
LLFFISNTPDSAILLSQDQAPPSSNPSMGNNPVAETREGVPQTLSEVVQEKLKEIFAWLQRDARDQFKDLDHFEEMLEPISRELPEDINASLEPISGLDIHYVAIRRALKICLPARLLNKRRPKPNKP